MLAHNSYEGVGASDDGLGLGDWQTWLLVGLMLVIAVPHLIKVK